MGSTLLIAWKDFKQIILSPSFFLVAKFLCRYLVNNLQGFFR